MRKLASVNIFGWSWGDRLSSDGHDFVDDPYYAIFRADGRPNLDIGVRLCVKHSRL